MPHRQSRPGSGVLPVPHHRRAVDQHVRDGRTRYRMLETIRQYSRSKLVEQQELPAVRARHREFFGLLAEEAEPEIMGAPDPEWCRRLVADRDNLREALDWSLHGDRGEEGARWGLRIAAALCQFWYLYGNSPEERAWLREALDRNPDAPARVRAEALTGAACMAWLQGDYERAGELHALSLALYREIGDPWRTAFSLNNLALQPLCAGDYDRAATLLEESLSLARDVGDPWLIALALGNLGEVARSRGDLARAEALYEDTLSRVRECGAPHQEALQLSNLGQVAWARADNEKARACFQEALRIGAAEGGWRAVLAGLIGAAAVCLVEHGAAEAVGEANRFVLEPPDRPIRDNSASAVRSMLGEQAFAAVWAEGRAMGPEQAVRYALEETDCKGGPARPPSAARP